MAAEYVALIGRRIREAREAKGLTQAELAAKLPGKSDGTQMSKWERGIHRPGDDTLEHIARVLEREVAWFLSAPPDKSKTPDPFTARAETDGDRLSAIEDRLAELDDRMGEIVSLLSSDTEATARLSDAIVRAVEQALARQAREAGLPDRRRRQLPPAAGQRPAA